MSCSRARLASAVNSAPRRDRTNVRARAPSAIKSAITRAADPRNLLDARVDEIHQLRDRARRTLGHALDRAADDIGHQRARARALSPLATLQRGYSVLQDADGHVLTSVADVSARQRVSVRVADGRIHATTTKTEQLEETDG